MISLFQCSISRQVIVSVLVVAASVMVGCSSPLKKESMLDKEVKQWRERSVTSLASSPSVNYDDMLRRSSQITALTDPVTLSPVVRERLLPKTKVSMQIRNADISVVLSVLSKMANQNIIMNEGVKGLTSVSAKNTPWDQVFVGLVKSNGLVYRWEGEMLRVLTKKDLMNDNDIDAILETKKLKSIVAKQYEPLVTSIFYVNYAAPENLKKTLESFITKDLEGEVLGSVSIDVHNRALVVTALKDDVARMAKLMGALDRPTKQIMIEAHIIETNRDTAKELGMQIGGINTNAANVYKWDKNYAEPIDGTASALDPSAFNSGFSSNYPAALSGAGLVVGAAGGTLGGMMIQAQLSALERQSKLNILSSPSITTLNNQVASVESGAQVPFQTINSKGDTEIVFKDVVLKLEVTPHVIDSRTLRLDILVAKDELDFTKPVNGYPTIIKKEVVTSVVLANGETTVVGGLTKEKTESSRSGTPGLSNLPLIGRLFRHRGGSSEMSEVMIFITPHILEQRMPGFNVAK